MSVAKRQRKEKPAKTERRKVEGHSEDRQVNTQPSRRPGSHRAGSGGGEEPRSQRSQTRRRPVSGAGPPSCLKGALAFACR